MFVCVFVMPKTKTTTKRTSVPKKKRTSTRPATKYGKNVLHPRLTGHPVIPVPPKRPDAKMYVFVFLAAVISVVGVLYLTGHFDKPDPSPVEEPPVEEPPGGGDDTDVEEPPGGGDDTDDKEKAAKRKRLGWGLGMTFLVIVAGGLIWHFRRRLTRANQSVLPIGGDLQETLDNLEGEIYRGQNEVRDAMALVKQKYARSSFGSEEAHKDMARLNKLQHELEQNKELREALVMSMGRL